MRRSPGCPMHAVLSLMALACSAVCSARALPLDSAASSTSLGALTSFTCTGAECVIVASTVAAQPLRPCAAQNDVVCEAAESDDAVAATAGTVSARVVFYTPLIVRYWLALDGNFSNHKMVGTDPWKDPIIGKQSDLQAAPKPVDKGAYWEVSSEHLAVRVNKSPVKITVLSGDVPILQESAPLTWNSTTVWQTLAMDLPHTLASAAGKEYFYGGGMQNGRWSHRGQAITVAKDYNWANNGHPNSAPWYLSTAGYGVLRNTWKPGAYSFGAGADGKSVLAAHNDTSGFDGFIVAGKDFKALLGAYTYLTGAPFLPPIYGMGLGDSDCYHNARHGNSTQVVLAVADQYRARDMPGAWFLPNDGYGCGYGEGPTVFPSNLTDLTYVVEELHKRGFYTGLWTSTGMPNIEGEVGVAGTRVCKTDVGWIGAGYEYAFDGVELCAGGIENNSDARRFIWTVEGWAGTQRNAVMWSGDDSGSYKYIKWQLPTFVGSGFSAQAHISGDVDGIFGGSATTYVRDLQFKCLMTTAMVMSGWAANPDKQPWTYGEPYTSINRMYLKLKSRLTPYMYTYSREATDTGVPPVRAMVMEFPHQAELYENTSATDNQFMAGEWILVAPVYDNRTVRDGIYLPHTAPVDPEAAADQATQWLDYWTGVPLPGNTTIDNYPAPLSTLPMFVRAGAIVPLWPDMNYFDEKPHDPITLELWPQNKSSFRLYEDDGITRKALAVANPEYARTMIEVAAPAAYQSGKGKGALGNVSVHVGAMVGKFEGALKTRGWLLNIRCKRAPPMVVLNAAGKDVLLQKMNSVPELEFAVSGWFWDHSVQKGLLMVKTPSMSTAASFTVTLSDGPSYPAIETEQCDTVQHHMVEPQNFKYDTASKQLQLVPKQASSTKQCVTISQIADVDSHAKAIVLAPCDPAKLKEQQWELQPSGQISSAANAKTCIDRDAADHHLIVYGCHNPSSAGNQAFVVGAYGTQHITSGADCWAVGPLI